MLWNKNFSMYKSINQAKGANIDWNRHKLTLFKLIA